MGVHILHIQHINIHGGVEYLKLLRGLVVEREPPQRDEHHQQPHEENVKGDVELMPPDDVAPYHRQSRIQVEDIEKQPAEEDNCDYLYGEEVAVERYDGRVLVGVVADLVIEGEEDAEVVQRDY